MNASVLHYVPTKPDSIPEQISQVEDVIVKKPDAIVFTPVDYKAMGQAVDIAKLAREDIRRANWNNAQSDVGADQRLGYIRDRAVAAGRYNHTGGVWQLGWPACREATRVGSRAECR